MHLGLIGYGTIAATLAQLLAEHGLRAERITVLTRAGREDAAREALAGHAVEVVTDAPALIAARPDIVVECAGHGAVSAHVAPVLAAGLDVALASVGALADAGLHDALLSAAGDGGARLILPAGAVGGTDLLAALAPAGGLEVTYTGTKPPAAWKGTPAETLLDLDALTEPAVFFEGNARSAAAQFPKNANVAATLALAGAGFEATRARLVADPAAPDNIHEYEVISPVARYSMRIENLASGNASTSLSTVYSLRREIANRVGPLAV